MRRVFVRLLRLGVSSAAVRRPLRLAVGTALLSSSIAACHAVSNSPSDVISLAKELARGRAAESLVELAFSDPKSLLPAIPTVVGMLGPSHTDGEQRAALEVLKKALVDAENANAAVKAGVVSHLSKLLASTDLVILEHAAAVVSVLAQNENGRKRVVDAAKDIVAVITNQSATLRSRQYCTAALSSLCCDESNHQRLVKSCPLLFESLASACGEGGVVQMHAFGVVAAMAVGPVGAKIDSKLTSQLLEWPLFAPKGEVQVHAAQVVAGIFKSPKAATLPWAQQGIVTLATLLMPTKEPSDSQVIHAALQGISDATHHAKLQPVVGSSPTIDQVIGQIESEDVNDSVLAMDIVKHLCSRSQRVTTHCVKNKCVSHIVAGARMHRKNARARRAIADLLLAMARHASHMDRPLLLQASLPLLRGLLQLKDVEVVRASAHCLSHLTVSDLSKFILSREKALEDVVKLLYSKDVVVLRHATKILANAASTENAMYGENALELRKLNAMQPLCQLMLSSDKNVHRHATWAIAAMTAYSVNHEYMGPTVSYLLKVLAGGTLEGKRFAALALSNIASTEKTRKFLNEKGTVRALYSCMQAHQDPTLQTVTTQALSNLIRNGTVLFSVPAPEDTVD